VRRFDVNMAETVCYAGHGGWFPWFPLVFFGFWLVVLLLVRPWAWRRSRWYGGGVASAEAVLAERFARGELSAEEYRAGIEVLRRR
jgi:putative membrane protein